MLLLLIPTVFAQSNIAAPDEPACSTMYVADAIPGLLAEGAPTDTVPRVLLLGSCYQGEALLLTLIDGDGQLVQFEEVDIQYSPVSPVLAMELDQSLQSNTDYTLRVQGEFNLMSDVGFQTGDGPMEPISGTVTLVDIQTTATGGDDWGGWNITLDGIRVRPVEDPERLSHVEFHSDRGIIGAVVAGDEEIVWSGADVDFHAEQPDEICIDVLQFDHRDQLISEVTACDSPRLVEMAINEDQGRFGGRCSSSSGSAGGLAGLLAIALVLRRREV